MKATKSSRQVFLFKDELYEDVPNTPSNLHLVTGKRNCWEQNAILGAFIVKSAEKLVKLRFSINFPLSLNVHFDAKDEQLVASRNVPPAVSGAIFSFDYKIIFYWRMVFLN